MTIDTGGTSFDVCVLPGRSIPITRGKRLENEPIAIPSVDVHTIGAGGGSIAWLDAGGALRVGPQSAGANPGPACYGRGGTEPTLTDAFVHLGYINPAYFLGGRTAIQPALADRAIAEKIAAPLGLDITGAAARVVEIMNSRLAGAMQLLSVERGIDPRPYTLLVGGGAGPLQACTLASRLGIARVIVPRWPGVLCASGLMRADVTHNLVRSFNTTAEAADLARLSALYDEMERALTRTLEGEGIAPEDMTLRRFIDARYSGQVYEIETPVPSAETLTQAHLDGIVAAYEDAHDTLYHYRMEGYPVEFVSCRVEAVGQVDAVTPEELPAAGPDPSAAVKGSRLAYPARRGAVRAGRDLRRREARARQPDQRHSHYRDRGLDPRGLERSAADGQPLRRLRDRHRRVAEPRRRCADHDIGGESGLGCRIAMAATPPAGRTSEAGTRRNARWKA